jgi:eukaryotic-like serine/threonine-protein kinase
VDALQPGDPQWVGRYRLVKRLGTGGMGRVFLGQSPGGRLVAVKLIRPELADDPGFRRRFAQEVSAARRVSGLFTAPVVDADPDGPQPWLVTAYVAGPSLSDAVEARGPMPVASVLTLAAGLAEGLGAVHAAGVVHRDLKPSNVLLASDGPRIIDFGISRATDSTWLTNVGGVVVGSPGFMSPEQAEGGHVGPPTDIFSLGGVLAYAATGLSPFGEGSASALLYRVVYGTAATGHVPAPLRRLVERCLAKDPADRPTAEELLAELGYAEPSEDWLSWSPAEHRPTGELAATQLDQPARWEAGDHDYISGNGIVLASSLSPERGRLASGAPVDAAPVDGSPAALNRIALNPAALNPVDLNPANGRPAGRHRADVSLPAAEPADRDSPHGHQADDGPAGQHSHEACPVGAINSVTVANPATVTNPGTVTPVTGPRSARHHPSSALIGAAVAAVLAAGTAAAVAYVVASDHDHVIARASALALQDQIGTGDRGQHGEASAKAQVPGTGPRAVVDSYLAAINQRDWPRAWQLGGGSWNPSYREMIDEYASTEQDAIRVMGVNGNQAIVRVRAYQADGRCQVYKMYFVVQDGMIVHATQQLLTTCQAARPRPDGSSA